jgi:hypothetical protein
MMRKIKYILVLLILSSVVQSAYAAIKIHGKVTDSENEPLEFVTVKIAGTMVGTTTGLDGSYQLSATESDTIKIIFSCIGFEEVKRQLIDAKDDVALNIKMRSLDHSLNEIQVTEYQKQTGAMQKISTDSYKLAADASGSSVESLIKTMAGVTSNNEMSSQYSVRGGTYDENLVYINGVEVYRPQLVSSGQQEGLSIINSDMVDAVNFSTGGFSSEYGDKMSSVLDITYREPESFEGSLSLSLLGGSFSIGQASKKFSQLHGIRYKSNSSLLSSLEDKGEYDPRYFDYQTNMAFRFNQQWKITFLGNIAINNYTFIPATRSTNFGTSDDAKQFTVYFDGQEKDKFETFLGAINLNYRRSRSTDFSILASGYQTNELVSYDISGEYWLDQAGTSGSNGIGGELGVGRYQEHSRNRLKATVLSLGFRGNIGLNYHNISYGVSANHEKIYDRTREWELRDSAGYSLPTNPELVKVIYNLESRQDDASNRFSAFLQDTWKVSTAAGYLNLNGGIRASYWDFNEEFLISPRVSIGFVPDKYPRWSYRFATGLYYQSPFYKEYRRQSVDSEGNTTITLNSDIKSQRSFQFILGTDYSFRAMDRPFKLSGEAYYKILSNLIPYEVENLKVVYTGENSSHGYTAGLDMKLFGQFVPGTDSWISFSLMKTQQELNGVNVPLPTDQRYSMAIYFTDFFPKFPKLKFSLRGIFSDGLPTVAPRGSRDQGYFRAPAYKRVDIGLSYGLITPPQEGETRSGLSRYLKSVWLGVDVFNLLDISNVSSYYWVTDVNDIQYAVPNYLTRRQLNVRLTINF